MADTRDSIFSLDIHSQGRFLGGHGLVTRSAGAPGLRTNASNLALELHYVENTALVVRQATKALEHTAVCHLSLGWVTARQVGFPAVSVFQSGVVSGDKAQN